MSLPIPTDHTVPLCFVQTRMGLCLARVLAVPLMCGLMTLERSRGPGLPWSLQVTITVSLGHMSRVLRVSYRTRGPFFALGADMQVRTPVLGLPSVLAFGFSSYSQARATCQVAEPRVFPVLNFITLY